MTLRVLPARASLAAVAVVALSLTSIGVADAAPVSVAQAPLPIRQNYAPDPTPDANDPAMSVVPPDPGIVPSMDVDVSSADVDQIPLSVQPGQTFTVSIDAASGATCSGSITFRGVPPVALPAVAANGAICAWDVTAPTIGSAGTAIVDVGVSRGGQSWRVAGVTYVNPPGESR